MKSKGNQNQTPANQPENNPTPQADPELPPQTTPNAPSGGPLTAAQLSGMTPGQVAAAVRGRVPSVAELRAMTADQSEDFGRFSDAQVQAWLDSGLYDVNVQKFHTAKTDQQGNPIEGWVDKPDDVPDGWEAWGTNGARRVGEPAAGQGQGSAQASGGGAAGAGVADDPGQRFLESLLSQQGGIFSGAGRGNQGAAGERLQGGGVWWNAGGTPAPVTPTPTANPTSSASGLPPTPAESSLTGALSQMFTGDKSTATLGKDKGKVAQPQGLSSAMATAFSPQRQPRQQQWWRV